MNVIEIIVVAYHILAVLLILSVLVDYALGFDKLKFIYQYFDDNFDSDNPVHVFLGLEFMCLILVLFIPIIGTGTSLFFITAITLLYFVVIVLILVLYSVAYGIEKIRNKRLTKNKNSS